MLVKPIHTGLIRACENINKVISANIKKIPERSVIVIASKLFSTCENQFVPKKSGEWKEKRDLIIKESEFYIEPHSKNFNVMLTIKNNIIFANAGIDESNADNQYILWPKDPQESVNKVWSFIRINYGVKEIGITMSDSSSYMLNWGVVGRSIAHCGFNPLRSYIGKRDLFGHMMRMEQSNVAQSITDAGVLEMGEGSERTPMALVYDLKNDIQFVNHKPTKRDLEKMKISIKDDIYAPLLKTAKWKKGGKYSAKLNV